MLTSFPAKTSSKDKARHGELLNRRFQDQQGRALLDLARRYGYRRDDLDRLIEQLPNP